MPEVMASWLKLTRAPRTRAGTTSPMFLLGAAITALGGLLFGHGAGRCLPAAALLALARGPSS